MNRIENNRKSPLIFAHFSGFDYRDLSISKNKNVPLLRHWDYGDLQPMFDYYKAMLDQTDLESYFKFKYSYNYYSNGIAIIGSHRRMYRRLLEMTEATGNPFDAEGVFFNNLKKK